MLFKSPTEIGCVTYIGLRIINAFQDINKMHCCATRLDSRYSSMRGGQRNHTSKLKAFCKKNCYYKAMNSKGLIWIFMFIGSIVGAYVPQIWGAGMFSMSSVFLSGLGALAGLWIGFKLSNW